MARRRTRAATRKVVDEEARTIANGIYIVARDLRGQKLALPVFLYAPMVYMVEMVASVICKRRKWERRRADQVARYLMAGLQEFVVALYEGFDEEHFEAWAEAAELRD